VAPLQHGQAARIARLQAARTGSVRAHLFRVAACATPTGSAGHASATTASQLTFQLDHPVGVDQSGDPISAMNSIPTTVVRRLKPNSEAAVALCADARLFPLACVVAGRLAQLADRAYDVYLFTEPNARIEQVPSDYPVNIELPVFLDRLPGKVRQNRFLSFSSLRLFVPEILPDRYRRILYVDCDIRVESSVAGLFELELAGASVAAVDDYTLPFLPYAKPKKNDNIRNRRYEIGHSPADPYFNAGVMLIDAPAWRSEQTTTTALALLDRLSAVNANDQEMLNVLFRGRWAALSPRWNFTFFHDLGFERALRPVLYHYAGAKPWEFRWDRSPAHLHALAEMFVDSPFADFLNRKPTHADYLRALIKQLKWSLRHRGSFPRANEIARRIRDALAPQMRAAFASYLIDNIQKRRFLDVRHGITDLDEGQVLEVLRTAGRFS
jgi:lipopolysaccharide biosynthesis glycosyltransferase